MSPRKKPAPEPEKKQATNQAVVSSEKAMSVSPETSPAASPTVPSPSPSNGKSILIVEDEQPLAHAMQMKLKNEGYDTTIVMSGVDALAELEKKRYGLILLDLIMPRMDGFSVLEQLKERKSTVPVIILSNLGQDEDRAKAKELGVTDYFVKSNTPITDIVQKIKSLY